jgi:hypothetical protein
MNEEIMEELTMNCLLLSCITQHIANYFSLLQASIAIEQL